MKKMKSLALLASVCVLVGFISGCNTVKGIGKDVSKGGQEIQKAAS